MEKVVLFLRRYREHSKHLAFALGYIKLTSIDNRGFHDSVADFFRTMSPAFHPKYPINLSLATTVLIE